MLHPTEPELELSLSNSPSPSRDGVQPNEAPKLRIVCRLLDLVVCHRVAAPRFDPPVQSTPGGGPGALDLRMEEAKAAHERGGPRQLRPQPLEIAGYAHKHWFMSGGLSAWN